jgi:hypothetical protein
MKITKANLILSVTVLAALTVSALRQAVNKQMENVVDSAVMTSPMYKQRIVHACAVTNDDVKTKGSGFLLNCLISQNRFWPAL